MALVLALLMLFSLAACRGSNGNANTNKTDNASEKVTDEISEAPQTEEVKKSEIIKIGHICDLTGSEAGTGAEAQRSLQHAVDALGGEISGYQIEVITRDSQSDPSIAADVARQLVEQDEVVAIFGPTLIGHKSAVSTYMETVGIPIIFYNPTPLGLLEHAEWTVGASGSTLQMPTVMADYVYNELDYRSIYTVTKDDTGGRSYMDPFIADYTALGGGIVSSQWAPTPTPDFSPYFVSMNPASADGIICWTSGSSAITFWEAWYNAGFSNKLPVVALFHGAFTDYFIPAALSNTSPEIAKAMLGTITLNSYAYDIDSPENEAFVKGWQEEFGAVPIGSDLPSACYQAIQLFVEAIKATDGDTSPDALIAAIKEADFVGPEGRIYFGDTLCAIKDVFIVKLVQLEDNSFNYSLVKEYKDVPTTGYGT